ncbi:hypothetical protein FBU30_002709 [Linnemannia zychae]|nr:hypothetical protein FBU30_002709 [Linnemannia zychae]
MSQNAIRPDDYKTETTTISEISTSSIDMHYFREHNNGGSRGLKDMTPASDLSQAARASVVTVLSKASYSTSLSGARHHTKARPLAIQTTSLHVIGKSVDNNNSKSHPNTANTDSNPSFTSITPNTISSSSTPLSMTSSSSSTNNSPMSHIRRWTSSLSSSKSSPKNNTKVRTIGPISAPQPLTTLAPYACTPLPYSDLPSPDHFCVSSSSLTASAPQLHSPRSPSHFDPIVPRSPSKAATSCPDLPVGQHAVEYYSNASTHIINYPNSNKNQRTSWKDRLFNSNPKKQDTRRASTNSNVDDDYEWTSNQESDTCSNSTSSTSSAAVSQAAMHHSMATTEKISRPRMRISPPLTQPVLPANQKTIPIIHNPLMSPTDDLFGPDAFDPFKIAPKNKVSEPSAPVSMMVAMTVIPTVGEKTSETISSLSPEHGVRLTVNTHSKYAFNPAQQPLTPPSSQPSEGSFSLSSPTSSLSFDKEKNSSSITHVKMNDGRHSTKPEAAVLDFAASLCEGLVSDFVMPPCYFDQHNLKLAFEDAYPRTDPDIMPKVIVDSPPSSPPHSPTSSRSSQGKVTLKDRSSKSSSTYSTGSDSSTSSTDSDSSGSSDSSLSPVSGASFFSSTPATITSPSKSQNKTSTLMKSSGIKIPSSLMTFLPSSSSNKPKVIPASPPATPPVSPPLMHTDTLANQNPTTTSIEQPSSGVVTTPLDPRAMMLKRLAYVHTLRKLREREKRPFRHTVLLHLVLLQLRRGITSQHCGEIAEFYVAMSTSHLSPRLDIANTMLMAQQQRNKLQQQQHLLSQQSSISHIPGLSSSLEPVQESLIPVRSSSKASSTSAVISSDKEPKSKRSLVFSLQNRNQANKTLGTSTSSVNNNSSSNVESGGSLTTTTATATTGPSQMSIFKERLPLLRVPAYPLINLEKNTNSTVLTSSPSRKNLATVESSEDDQGIEESNFDYQSGVVQPAPTVIIPKRTTGRKGLLYQQQLQLRIRQQESMMMGGIDQMTMADQDPAWSQLIGIRPRFATSTFTTIRTDQSEIITLPLVPPESVKPLPTADNLASSSLPLNSYPCIPLAHRSSQGNTTNCSAGASTNTTTSVGGGTLATSSISQDDNGSLTAGLLTPPLSPLLRTPFSTAAPAVANFVTSTGSAKPNDGLSYNCNTSTTTANQNNFNTAIPPPLPPTSSNTANNSNININRSSYNLQGGQYSPPLMSSSTFPSHHTRVTSTGSISSYMTSHVQNSHRALGFLDGQAVHSRSWSNYEGKMPTPPLSSPSVSTLSRNMNIGGLGIMYHQQQLQPCLPSPPLSPTLEAEGQTTAMFSNVSASMKSNINENFHFVRRPGNLPQRSHSSNGYIHHSLVPGSGSNHNSGMGIGGRSDIAWIMRAPSPVAQQQRQQQQHELQLRHNVEDLRNRHYWISGSPGPIISTANPIVSSSVIATAPVAVHPPGKKAVQTSSSKGEMLLPEESEEEDMPLAFVQRRISNDTFRSMV